MSLVRNFGKIITSCKKEYRKKRYGMFKLFDNISEGSVLCFGDNADFMKYLLQKKDMAGKIAQIYIDPPFFSKATYEATVSVTNEAGEETKVKKKAYQDIWDEGMEEYLKMLGVRLMLMKDLLSDNGTIWVHLDWHGMHYVKVLMDEIFGEKNFVNEIIWTYKSGGSSKSHFARKHDSILVYSKTKNYYLDIPKEKSYNRDLKPYRFKGVEEFKDDVGWYTLVNMKDVWPIDMVGRTSQERTGYATQKPEALIERILKAGSREGDLVADFFAGSSTLAKVADDNGRHWICCDNSEVAIESSIRRLENKQLSMI
jgi:adenine specific DNA methylase Mod